MGGLYESNGLLYFRGDDGVNQPVPWVTDGTVEGTLPLLESALDDPYLPIPLETLGVRDY